jgi:autotransporter-associated beta strand protein
METLETSRPRIAGFARLSQNIGRSHPSPLKLFVPIGIARAADGQTIVRDRGDSPTPMPALSTSAFCFTRVRAFRHVIPLLAFPLLCHWGPWAQAADFYWDGDPATSGAQYGSTTGVWTSSGSPSNWNTTEAGGSNIAWVNATNSIARFGSATSGTVPTPATLTLSLGENITLQGIDMGGSYKTTVTITNDAGNNYTLNFGTANGQIKPNAASLALTIDVVMQGTNGITKTNNGTAILTQNNTYSGGTTISAGTLQIGNGGTTGSLGSGDVTVATGTTLRFNRSDDIVVTNKITGLGTLVHAAASTLTLGNSANSVGRLSLTAAGTVEILGNTLGIGVDGGSGIQLTTAGVTANINGTGGGKIAINGEGMDVALVNGTCSSVDISGGTVVFTAANTYTGATRVNAGTLRLKSATSPAVQGDITVAAGASLIIDATVSNQIADGASVVVNGTFNSSNRLDTFANLTIDTNSTSTFSNLTITGTLTVTKGIHDALNSSAVLNSHTTVLGGGSTLQLGANSGNSLWTMGAGGLTMTGTTIKFGNLGAAGRIAQVNLGGDVTASGTNAFTVGSTAVTANVDLQGATRTFNITDGITTITPIIQGANDSGITKTGAGTLVLHGTNTYTGKTTISGGTLSLALDTVTGRTGSVNASPWIQVDAGATLNVADLAAGGTGSYTLTNQVLSGSGTVSGKLVVGSGSTLRPGGSSNAALSAIASAGDQTGTLTTGDLTLTGGATALAPRLLLNLAGTSSRAGNPMDAAQVTAFSTASSGGQYDSVVVSGTLTLDAGSTITVEFAPGYKAQWGDVFNLVDWSVLNLNADGTGGSFTLTDLVVPTNLDNGWYFATDQFLSHGIIYVVPEPSRALLLVGGCLGLFLPRRRRRALNN